MLVGVYGWCTSSGKAGADVVKAETGVDVADEVCEDCGYEPELKRTLGSFQVFAVSFAFISVAVGIFGTYDDVLEELRAGGDLALGRSWRSGRR